MRIETRVYKGLNINVFSVTDVEIPESLQDGEEIFLLAEHRKFTYKREGFDLDELVESLVKTDLSKMETETHYLYPLYLYDHSGLALHSYRHCKWDSSFVGLVLVKKEGVTNVEAKEKLSTFLETWNMYLEGDFYKVEAEVTGETFYELHGLDGIEEGVKLCENEIDGYLNKLNK